MVKNWRWWQLHWFISEWDWGGFPGWFYSMNPSPKPRSSDPTFLQLVCFPYYFMITLIYLATKFFAFTSLVVGIVLLFFFFQDFYLLHASLFFCFSLSCLYITIIEVWTYYSLAFKVERWWGNLLPKFVPLLYDNGGPIIMVQVCCFLVEFIYCICLIDIIIQDVYRTKIYESTFWFQKQKVYVLQ